MLPLLDDVSVSIEHLFVVEAARRLGVGHALLARASSRIVLASFTDVLDEPRQPNLPGTTDAYPNWRIPLPLPTEEVLRDPRVQATVAALRNR